MYQWLLATLLLVQIILPNLAIILNNDRRIEKIKLLPSLEECGQQMTFNKIIYGNVAESGEFTWTALLRYRSPEGQLKYRCHGSVISTKYVITAAHCLNYENKRIIGDIYSVVLGEYDTRNYTDCAFTAFEIDCSDPIQEFSIENYRVHPDFSTNNTPSSDIGLIRLNGTVHFSDFVKPICLPLTPLSLKVNETLWISGWGRTGNRDVSGIKLKRKVRLSTNKDCVEHFGHNPDATEVCVGSSDGSDFGQGHGGGPLMVDYNNKDSRKIFLVGIVSLGPRSRSVTSIYTNVTYFVDWILSNIEGEFPSSWRILE